MQPEQNKWLTVVQPLPPPAINPELEKLNAIVRSAECLRHFVLSIEFWISPGGRLRQWMRLNSSVTAVVLIPAVSLMPTISLVLHEVDGWLSLLVSIVLKAILLSTLVTLAVLFGKHFPSSSQGSSRRRK